MIKGLLCTNPPLCLIECSRRGDEEGTFEGLQRPCLLFSKSDSSASFEPVSGTDCVLFTFGYQGVKLLAWQMTECRSEWTEVRHLPFSRGKIVQFDFYWFLHSIFYLPNPSSIFLACELVPEA
jgi:hypothetical protein